MERIAVLGVGGVGGFLAAALARAGRDVTVVARDVTASAIERGGLEVESERLGSFEVRVRAVTELPEPADGLIVATKARDLEPALERVAAEPAIVLPLLNGLDHLVLLRERFGSRAVAGSIRIEAFRTSPTHVVQTSRFLGARTARCAHPSRDSRGRSRWRAFRPG